MGRNGRTVLIVEDSPEGRQMYATALEAAGFTVVQAGDGAEGIRLATETPPDIVVMNVSMPHVNGVDAVEILKAHPLTEHVPILVVTGHGSTPAVREGAWEAGCDDFLAKPVGPGDLVTAVANCIDENGRRRGTRQV
jgi:CheY-like chemotaxis protein